MNSHLRTHPKITVRAYCAEKAARLGGAIFLVVSSYLLIWFLVRSKQDFIETFITGWHRNSAEALVVWIGAAIAVMCVAWASWVGLRIFFPSRFEGKLHGWSVETSTTSKQRLIIGIGGRTVRALNNPVLMGAMRGLEPGTELRITVGPNGFVLSVDVFN